MMEGERVSDRVFGGLTQLSVRHPCLIRHLNQTELTIEIAFYIEELAMECAQAFLDAGITAIHRLDQARVVSLQLPSLLAQEQAEEAVGVLGAFLTSCVARQVGRQAAARNRGEGGDDQPNN